MVSFFISKKTTFRSVFANNSVFNLHFMKVSTENDNNFGYEKITIVVDNIPLRIVAQANLNSIVKFLWNSKVYQTSISFWSKNLQVL